MQDERRADEPAKTPATDDVPAPVDTAEPAAPDGQFDSQDMPTTDGEMTDGGAEGAHA